MTQSDFHPRAQAQACLLTALLRGRSRQRQYRGRLWPQERSQGLSPGASSLMEVLPDPRLPGIWRLGTPERAPNPCISKAYLNHH